MAKKNDNTFFFKLEPAQLLSALIQIPESERGAWITRIAVELATNNPVDPFAKQLFDEAQRFKQDASERSRQAGLASAKKRKQQALAKEQQKSTDVEQALTDDEQLFNECQQSVNEIQPISSSSSSSSTEVKEESKEKTCPEPSDSEPAYQLILKDKTYFDVSEEQVEEWEEIYTDLDVRRELSKMAQWCENTPAKRKTRGGCNKFICRWLDREERKQGERTASSPHHPPNLFDEAIRSVSNKNKAEHPYGRHYDDDYRIIDPEKTQQAEDYIGRLIREANGH